MFVMFILLTLLCWSQLDILMLVVSSSIVQELGFPQCDSGFPGFWYWFFHKLIHEMGDGDNGTLISTVWFSVGELLVLPELVKFL